MPHTLTSDEFETLLHMLGPDREQAGARYEQLRRRLLTIFSYRRCAGPEELADATLDRAARKLLEMANRFEGGDPSAFIFAVAWRIARESFRQPRPDALPEGWEVPDPRAPGDFEEEKERERVCLERCLERLPEKERALVLQYHGDEKRTRIRLRSMLARHLSLTPNALRLKIHRITLRLRDCVFQCVDLVRTQPCA